MKTFLKYGGALIALYLIVDHVQGTSTLGKSATSFVSGSVKAFQGTGSN